MSFLSGNSYKRKKRITTESLDVQMELLCWMIWFFYSVFKVFDIPIELKLILISIFVVIIISAVVLTFCLTKKIEASTRDMISDIEELTV